jgi:hypothetical protein
VVDPESGDNIAVDAIQKIYRLWQVDADRARWVGDKPSSTELYGFDWWPGDFKVAVRIFGPHPERSTPIYKLSVGCDFLTDVDISAPSFLKSLSLLNRFSPSFSLVSLPKQVAEEATDKYGVDPGPMKVSLESTAYLHEGISEWLPRFFAGQTILQPIESQERAIIDAKLLGGQPDRSRHPDSNLNMGLDDMLGVENDYAALGRASSRWVATGEFEAIIEKWGRCDTAFGTADATGLTIETPFGDDSALLSLKTDQPHPRLGNGLLAVLKIPRFVEPEKAISDANWLNFLEARTWTSKGMPFIGSWTTDIGRAGEPGLMCVAYGSFIPNFIYNSGLAENLVLWGIARAGWAREILWPNAVDRPMHEILSQRHRQVT